MEPISQDEVLQILKIVEESTFDELCLEMGDFKLILRKHAGSEPVQGSLQAGEISSHTETAQEKSSVPVHSTKTAPGEGASVAGDGRRKAASIVGSQEEGYIPIRSPMLGTFYRAPKPGAPPFVEEGQMVNADDTVCIIEVMKLFNTVKSGVRGRIAKTLVEDGVMVEFQQTLFLVEEAQEDENAGEDGAS